MTRSQRRWIQFGLVASAIVLIWALVGSYEAGSYRSKTALIAAPFTFLVCAALLYWDRRNH